MWTCPKCARVFKRTNQGHYCGKAPETADEYAQLQSPEAQAHIARLREIFHRCVPEARERIAWSMPQFEMNGRCISFAACKSHVSLYLDAETIGVVQPLLEGFVIRKNAVYLSYDRELPVCAIECAVKLYFETERAVP